MGDLFDDDNIGIVGGLAQGVKAGIQGYRDAQEFDIKKAHAAEDLEDRKMRRIHLAAQLAAAKTEADRKMDEQNVEGFKAGLRFDRDPVSKRITDAHQDPNLVPIPKPLNPVQEDYYRAQIKAVGEKPTMNRNEVIRQAAEKGYKATFDEAGNVTMTVDPSLAPQMTEKDKAMIEESRARRDEARAGRQAKLGEARNAQTDKMAKAMRDSLDPNLGRAGNMGKNQARVDAADRVDALFKQFPDYNIPKGQTTELTSAIAGLINGGSAQSQHQIDAMTPSSMKGDVNAIAAWLTNEPRGQGQQEYMKLMHETAVREREIAQNQVKSAQIQRLSSHKRLREIDPATYNDILSSYGIDPKEIDEKGRFKPGGGLIKEGMIGNQPQGLIQGKTGQQAPQGAQPVPSADLMKAQAWLSRPDIANSTDPQIVQKRAAVQAKIKAMQGGQ
jgi:hypothetical protein